MDPERWGLVKTIYSSALDRDPCERSAFLEAACQGDRELLSEIESLLAQESIDSFLERPAWQGTTPGEDEPETPPSRWPPHPFLWLVGITLASLVALFAYAAWQMPRSAPSFRWTEVQGGLGYQVARVDPAGPAAGKLQPGDLLIRLNGDSNVAKAGTQPYRAHLKIGERYRVQVRRAGQTHDYVLETVRARPNFKFRLSYFLIGLAWCAVGLFIGFARPQDAVPRLAFAAAASAGVVFLTVGNLPGFYALQPLHMILGYHFFFRFPSAQPRALVWRAILWTLYVGVAVRIAFTMTQIALQHADGPQAATDWLAGPIMRGRGPSIPGVFMLAACGAIAVAIHKYRILTDTDERRRFHWVAVGGVVGLGPAALWAVFSQLRLIPGVALWLLPGESWVSFSLAVNACSVAAPACVAYAVVRHNVFDIKVALRLGLKYLLARRVLQFLLALPSVAFVYTLMTNRDRTIADLVTGTTGYLYAIVALGLSLKFRGPLLRWLDHRFFREQYDSDQIVASLVDQMARFDSAEEVTGYVFEQIERTLHPQSIRVWWREGEELRLARSEGPAPPGLICPLSEETLDYLAHLPGAARVPLPPAAGVSSVEARWLSTLGVRLIVPVNGPERFEGLLMLGAKRSEEPYSGTDERLLHTAAMQAGVVRDNLRLKGLVIGEQRIRREVLARLDHGLVKFLQECPVCGACYDSAAQTCDRDGHALAITLPVTRTIDGKYRLDQSIGKGGMGAVYEALDLRLNRRVAAKVMLSGGFGHEAALRRFRREAQAAARLNHPNIVRIYDFGELEGGGAYLVMERLHGVTLRAEMHRAGVFTAAEAADWLEQILDGLAAAHDQGLVHRDLKPENVLGERQTSGALSVKILDFGLAKNLPLTASAQTSQLLTESGVVLGTLGYMAPEQLAGQEVDQRADIYSAGVILVEMLTGRRPSDEDTNPLAMRYPALNPVLSRCTARRPEERVSSATGMSSALIPVLRTLGPGTSVPNRSHLTGI